MATSPSSQQGSRSTAFAIAPLDSVEKSDRLFARKHPAAVAGRNPRRPGGVKFVALGKRRALVEGGIRSAHAGAEQRRRFGDEDAVQSTVPIVVGEPPKGHAVLACRAHIANLKSDCPGIVGLHAAHQIDDQDMKGLMIDMGDRCYDFLTELYATWTARRGERSFHRTAISSLMGLRS